MAYLKHKDRRCDGESQEPDEDVDADDLTATYLINKSILVIIMNRI